MRLNVTAEDFLKGELCEVGWHPAQIVSYDEKMSQRKPNSPPDWAPSVYAEIQFKVTDGPNKGKILYQNFSEKAQSFIIPLLEALGATVDKKKGFTGDISREKLLGKTVDVHVIRGSFNNKPKDEIDGYKPYTGKGAAA